MKKKYDKIYVESLAKASWGFFLTVLFTNFVIVSFHKKCLLFLRASILIGDII